MLWDVRRKVRRLTHFNLERKKDWWRWQLSMDYLDGHVPLEALADLYTQIDSGIEYVGVARRR